VVLLWTTLVVLTSAAFAGRADAGSACLFRRLTGVPCPTCGATRGARDILAGQPGRAFASNPMLASVFALALALLLLRLLAARRLVLRLGAAERRAAWTLGVLGFAAGWAWVVVHQV
jgi:hypothetical protein